MESSILKQAASFLREQKNKHRWLVIFLCMAGVVALGTVTALMLQGQAMTHKVKVLDCQYVAHTHTVNCFDEEQNLVCGYADYVVHVHNDDCYDSEGSLVCPLPEIEKHTHTDACYQDVQTLVCMLEESEGHHHTDACYTAERGDLVCGMEEHTHSDACYDEYGDLVCGMEEHTHGDDCYTWNNVLTCTLPESEGHIHNESCYKTEKELVCGKLELHTHDDSCYEVKEGVDEDEDGEDDKVLICKIPVLEEHVHGENCFKTVELTAEEVEELNEENAEKAAAEAEENTAPETTEDGQTADAQIGEGQDGQDDPAAARDGAEGQTGQEDGEETAIRGDFQKVYEDASVKVIATYDESAGIPEEAELRVTRVTAESDPTHYEQRREEALNALDTKEAGSMLLYNIGFFMGADEIEPATPVNVTIQFMEDGFPVGTPIKVVHFADEGTKTLTGTDVAEDENGNLVTSFQADSFSDFAVINENTPMTIAAGNNLQDYIKGMTLQKKDPNTGEWVDVKDGDEIVLGSNYRMTVHFEGGDGFQETMTWNLGDNVKCAPKTGEPIWDGTTQIGTYDLTEDGQVTVHLFESFLKNGNQKLDMKFDMVASGDSGDGDNKFPWSGQIKDSGTVKNTAGLQVQKTAGWYSSDSGSIAYTVEASVTEGMVLDGVLSDAMGEGLSFRDIESMKVYDSEGKDVTERYKEYIDKLNEEIKKHEKKGESNWSLGPLPPLSEGMKFVVQYKGEVAAGNRTERDYVAKNDVTFSGKKPDGTDATPATDHAEKPLAKDQITKSGNTVIVTEDGKEKEVIQWQVRIGSGQWDSLETDPLTVKDTLGEGLTFRKSEKIKVQFCDKDGNVKKEAEIDWNDVTLTENGKVAQYELTKELFGSSYNWESGDYLMVTYNTDFDQEKQPQNGFENTVENSVLAPEGGVTGRLPVGEAVQKTVVDNEKEGYLTYTVVVDVPPASHMKSMKGDSGDGHPELDLPYFYIEDRLDFGDDYFALNVPKDVSVHVEGKTDAYDEWFEMVPYTEGPGNGEERETFQILDGPNSSDSIVGKNRRAFRIYFNTARYGLGTEKKLEKHDSIWDLDFATKMTITYKIPYDTVVVDKEGNDTGMVLGELLAKGMKLENRALSRRSGVDLDDRCYLQKNPTDATVDKLARYQGDGIVEYSVSFVNSKEGEDSRLITNEENDEKGRYYVKLDPKLLDTFDERMEYVDGSLYVEVRNKEDSKLYDSFKYTGEGPVKGSNQLEARIVDFTIRTEGDDPTYATIGDSFAAQRKYVFVYKLRLKEEYRKDWEADNNIENKATFQYGDNTLSDSTTVDIPSDMLQKSFEVTAKKTLKYTLKVNPFAIDLVKLDTGEDFVNLDSYKLVDEMSENLQLVTDGSDYKIDVEYWDSESGDWKPLTRSSSSTNIKKESLNYFRGSEGENGIYFILPDELAIRIVYETIVTGEVNSQEVADNTATLYADHTETDEKTTIFEVGDSGATGSSEPVIRVEKTDAENGSLLPGAKFALYSSKKQEGAKRITVQRGDKSIDLYEVGTEYYVTDEFGAINKIAPPSDAGEDDFYALVETEAPEGYNMVDEPVFFRFPGYKGSAVDDKVTYNGKEYKVRHMAANETIEVENPPEVYELPETGGPGMKLYTMSGLLLLAGVALMYNKKLRERRSRSSRI